MTQAQFILLAFKITEIAAVVTIIGFTACYTWWTKGKCWGNPIGRTILYEGFAIVGVLVPSILSIFINFNRLTSHIAAWFDVAAFALVPTIMIWRTFVFGRIHGHHGGLPSNSDAGNPEDDN